MSAIDAVTAAWETLAFNKPQTVPTVCGVPVDAPEECSCCGDVATRFGFCDECLAVLNAEATAQEAYDTWVSDMRARADIDEEYMPF